MTESDAQFAWGLVTSPVAGFFLPLAFTYPVDCQRDNAASPLYTCKNIFGFDPLGISGEMSLFISLVLAVAFFLVYRAGIRGRS